MPAYGALKHELRMNSGKKLKRMTIDMPEAEGRKDYIVHHDHHPPHKSEDFRFAPNENADFAEHLSKHLGIELPGKAAGESAESAESKAGFE